MRLIQQTSVIKTLLQRILRGLGLYDWFKNETFAYDVYDYFKEGRPITWRRQQLAFYRRLIRGRPARPLIFDVGANYGKKTDLFLKLGARVVAVDPDPASLLALRRKYGSRFGKARVTIVDRALSNSEGTANLWITQPGNGLNTLSEKWVRTLKENPGKFGNSFDFPIRQPVNTTTLGTLIEAHGLPSYIKIDVEGHEALVLRGLPIPVPVISFEANLPEFGPEASECIDILCRLAPAGRFNLTSDDTYKGFILGQWQTGEEITALLGTLGEKTVEIYWKSVVSSE